MLLCFAVLVLATLVMTCSGKWILVPFYSFKNGWILVLESIVVLALDGIGAGISNNKFRQQFRLFVV